MPKFKGWIVKVGGSLARAATLPAWLAKLAAHDMPCIVVPGGGPFTAPAAALQTYWQLADSVAHRMAILGMTQFGLMLHGLAPGIAPAGLAALEDAPPTAGARLWLPDLAAVEQMTTLPADWRVTADSIALWLAARLQADGLVLVKSAAVPTGEWTPTAGPMLAAAAAQGWVDEYFPQLFPRVGCRLVMWRADLPEAAEFPAS